MWNATQYGWTALMLAAYNGHAGCTRLLLDGGADKEAKTKVRLKIESLL
jgi:ankyrin repeat protein